MGHSLKERMQKRNRLYGMNFHPTCFSIRKEVSTHVNKLLNIWEKMKQKTKVFTTSGHLFPRPNRNPVTANYVTPANKNIIPWSAIPVNHDFSKIRYIFQKHMDVYMLHSDTEHVTLKNTRNDFVLWR